MTERERFEKWLTGQNHSSYTIAVAWQAWQASAREQAERLKLADKKLAEFGQVWDGEKYVFDGRESFSREAGTPK